MITSQHTRSDNEESTHSRIRNAGVEVESEFLNLNYIRLLGWHGEARSIQHATRYHS